MKPVIKKAIEGGWNKDNARVYDCDGYDSQYVDELMLMDKTFWQALGKACGWKGKKRDMFDKIIFAQMGIDIERDAPLKDCWKLFALRFHEINLTEGWDKAVEYLNSLIK